MSELHVLLVPGGSKTGPWHWQQWLAARLPDSGAVVTTCPSPAESHDPLAALRVRLARTPPEAELAVVAHRRGAALWLRHAATLGARRSAADGVRRADRVLLVAPDDQVRAPGSRADVLGEPDAPALREAGGPTRLVVGADDPASPVGAAHALAHRLRVELDVLAEGRGLDTAAGYGPWPALLRWVLYGSVPVADRFDSAPCAAGWSPVPEGVR
ncbi:alpha/beta hydrolase [Saccharopolyspora sp. NFXS83]|uniref:RBBP9/YdeN family alpha/beta hydrolase n=1 Tax=Saccharopolyspora sp. NFXS83 TaxID=2993560 RepID=UPI00224B0E36|nr:alpha/beta hydrolase [Saccharopolyspora sp. NFXS83]MCX2731688.1 alpha/beta hydrolase [Saccharopolyspora sp. NFXS83]